MSFTNGGPDPTKHVNFTPGMVLGVDDFTQEFTYLNGQNTSLGRELSGSGTLWGLDVSIRGAEVTVSPGAALSLQGRLISVSQAQCADLAVWIDQRHDLTAGEAYVHVVLSYATKLTDSVAIPADPQTPPGQLTSPSRMKDDFDLAFALEPVDRTEEFADRGFAHWVASLAYADGGEATIDDLLTALRHSARAHGSPPTWPPKFPPPPGSLRIPAAHAVDYLRAALACWITELSPEARGGGFGPVSTEVLLARIRVEIEENDAGGCQLKAGSAKVQEHDRPLVLSTGLLQELLLAPSNEPSSLGHVAGIGRFEILRDEDHEPRLETVFAENLEAKLVPRPGTPAGRGRQEETRGHELYVRLRLETGYHERHRYLVLATPLVEGDGARYAIEEVLNPPHEGVGSHSGPFMVRLSPVAGTARSRRVGFSVQVSDLGPAGRGSQT